jgi:LmbE family N-acetylglucosaminyl deacetylase
VRLIVVSPHLDDAVLSVGQLLAGHPTAEVVTVCTADPPIETGDALSEYDRRSGFETSRQAMAARRMEDRRACSTLDVPWLHLGETDSQYGQPVDREVVARLLSTLIERPKRTQLLGPLGMLHPDHEHVRDAVLDVGAALKVPTFLYAELPYRVVDPFEFCTTLDLVTVGHAVTLCDTFLGTGDRERKRLAVECYASQRWAIEPDHCMAPEIVWEATR